MAVLSRYAQPIRLGHDAEPLAVQLADHDVEPDEVASWQRDADAITYLKGRILPDGQALRAYERLATLIGQRLKAREVTAGLRAAYQAKQTTPP
jgi:hypothetical protein